MKKRFLFALFLGLFVTLGIMSGSANSSIRLQVFGSVLSCDVPPVIENDRTLVPLRSVFESMKADVNWNGDKQLVTVEREDMQMELTIGSKTAYVNGKAEAMDVAPKLIGDRTMIPVRFVSEKLGYLVDWDEKSQTVIIEKDISFLTKIELEKTQYDNLLNLAMDTYQEPKISTLSDPYRIVLDFTDVAYARGDGNLAANTGWIREIRWAEHGDDYRVVIECNGKQPYRYVRTGAASMSIIVGTAETNQEQQPGEEQPEQPPEPPKPVEKPVRQPKPKDQLLVMIDAGHGGKDPGAMPKGEDGEYLQHDGEAVREKDITLSLALKVRDALAENGVNVQMTRSTDKFLELSEIAEIANRADADLFVSIHCNSFDGAGPNGVEVLTHSTDGKDAYGITSNQIAKNILAEYVPVTEFYNRGIKDGSWLAVLKRTDMPGVLVETGFLTNEENLSALLDGEMQTKMAQAIARGIIKSIQQMP